MSYVLTFALGACIGGFVAVMAIALCMVAAECSRLEIFNHTDETGGE